MGEEPANREASPGGRFVVLRHEGTATFKPGVHWDLMLERGQALRTWALAELPTADREADAEQLPEHRLAYLDYEGPVSGGRGTVSRFDAGMFQVLAESDSQLVVLLNGKTLVGRLILHRVETEQPVWKCKFDPD